MSSSLADHFQIPSHIPTSLQPLIQSLSQEIQDPEEESFLLFSQPIPSQNLGFVDPTATTIDISIGNTHDFTIRQSPGLLNSNRAEGTTGAVLWKVTPLIASWLSSPENVLRRYGVLGPTAWVVELGCGISGLIGLAVAPGVGGYVLTDQGYVMRTLRENVAANDSVVGTKAATNRTGKKAARHSKGPSRAGNLHLLPYDWEDSSPRNVTTLLEANGASAAGGVDLVVACDCIYNDFLVVPLVRTCAELCRLREGRDGLNPTICVAAQQLRSEEVLQAWLAECMKFFHVWRCPDELLTEGLKEGDGFVVHICVLRDGEESR